MPMITLPDGQEKNFAEPVTLKTIAQAISPTLLKAALAGKVNGKLVDLSYLIKEDAQVLIITAKDKEALEIIRHSTAHLLAQAVKALFPSAKITIGPVIDQGFYYDIADEHSLVPEDLEKLEIKMQELASQAQTITRQEWTRQEAIDFFESQGESYKVEIIRELPSSEVISVYTQGDFTDLCRGPHVPHTGHLKVFKLMRISGAYWRGDSKNPMLQRIYGTAFFEKSQLQEHLHQLEEAEKRDHRKIGKHLGLFHFQAESPGMVFWHPKGWSIFQSIERHIRTHQSQANYQEVRTPQVVDIDLWKRSGHADKYLNNMFLTHSENRDYAIKPMNCPCHVQIFNQGIKSYKDLPLRLSEFGSCHRNETSGSLHGLLRVRSMVQDDGHIFCTPEQIQTEVAAFLQQAFKLYRDFGLTEVQVKIALRPIERIGDDALWDQAEGALALALEGLAIPFELLPGEGAFYGPKIELHLKDSIGRTWQCGTIQVDYFTPERLGASYAAQDNSKKTPIMLHRASVGSLERFIGMLIEHYAGAFPFWLSPIQTVILNISEKQTDYALSLLTFLKTKLWRAEADLRNEKIGFKIRDLSLQKIPYLLVVGDLEVQQASVSIRSQQGENLGSFSWERLDQFFSDQMKFQSL